MLSLNLDGEDLDGHVFIHDLGLPDAAEAPPGLHLQQLQRLETQQGGGRRRARILEDKDRRAGFDFITKITNSNVEYQQEQQAKRTFE